jgi:general secretion pathway protein L
MNTSTENFKEALARLKQQLVASRFLRWWLAELASMAPAWMRSASGNVDSFALVPLEQVSAQFVRPDTSDQRDLALILPPARVLRKTLILPLATEENLRQVLEFQMEQHTPFPADKLYFGYHVTGRDFERGQLSVEFVATPREGVDAAIKTLAGLSTSVRAVFAADMLATDNLVNLLPAGLAKAPSALRHGANPWLAALVALLAVTAMAIPVVIKREAVVQLLPWVEKGKKTAEAVDALRRELEARVDKHNYLLEKRQLVPTVIQALEELTRVLPDDTWVQTLDIKGRELQIQGETASSVRLIGLFEQSSMFREASFRSPLTKGQSSGTERYQLALQIRPVATLVPDAPVAQAAMPTASAAVASPASAPVPAASAEKMP